jgi:hypothetical protein
LPFKPSFSPFSVGLHSSGRQTDDLISQYTRSADATVSSAGTAFKNLKNSQRAWLGIAGAELIGDPGKTKSLSIKVNYQNTGNEPAQKIKFISETFATGAKSTANTSYGVLVFGASANTAFQQNIIDITNVHIHASAGIQIGVSTANATHYRWNDWTIGGINPAGASASGLNTFGVIDRFDIGAITNSQGTLAQGG